MPELSVGQVEIVAAAQRGEIHVLRERILAARSVGGSVFGPVSSKEEAAVALLALDSALGECNPKNGPTPHSVLPLVGESTNWARTGILNSAAAAKSIEARGRDTTGIFAKTGLLLPRWARPEDPEDVGDLFSNVNRVPPEMCAHISYRRATSAISGDAVLSSEHTQRGLVVGCAPFAESLEEVIVEAVLGPAGDPRYRIRPNPTILISRISEVIANLDASNAVIGLLPEGCLDEELLKAWQTQLKAGAARPRAASDREHNFQWIVVGSGPTCAHEPPPNEAVLLTRDGEVLLRQRKRTRFTLDDKTVDFWCLDALRDAERREEDIDNGAVISILETDIGRFSILVCEDHNRPLRDGTVIRAAGVSHLLVPVFDRELTQRRWHHAAGRQWWQDIGSRAVVSNSLVISNERARRKAGAEEVVCWHEKSLSTSSGHADDCHHVATCCALPNGLDANFARGTTATEVVTLRF